jgi:hypothetical protein
MPLCRCGRETTRLRITYDEKGAAREEICPGCAPMAFDEPFRVPSDNRIYSGPQAMPHLYKRGADDVFRAKDELIQDTVDLWDKGPTERAREHKARTRRTGSLTPAEIAASKHWGEQVLAPVVRENGIAGAAALLAENVKQ